VGQRVFRDGTPEQQEALPKDELARYATKLHHYERGSRTVIEVFGIDFPVELRTFVDDPHPQPYGRFTDFSIEQGKALLAKLDETAKKDQGKSIEWEPL
jgi:hypothetical protein